MVAERAPVRSVIVARKKALVKISLAEMDTFNTSVMMQLVGRLCAPARTAAIMKRRVQTFSVPKT
jgi:hypothetical protein